MATPLGFSPDTDTWVPLSLAAMGLGTAAVQNIGTSGANVPLLSTANVWSLAQTFTLAPVFTDKPGSRTALGLGTAAVQNTGTVGTAVPLLNTANTWSALQSFRLDAAGAATTPIYLNNGATWAAGQEVNIDLNPTTNAIGVRSAQIAAYAISNSQVGLKFRVSNATLPFDVLTIPNSGGLVVGNPSGGDVGGTGRLNAVALYESGVALVSKYGALATVNTWALAQTFSGGLIALNNATSNVVNFGTSGVGAPTLTTVSAGQKITLFNSISGAQVDFALGIEAATMWLSVPSSGSQFRFYAGTAVIASLSGVGVFNAASLSEATVALSAKYGQLAVANVWTASQTISLGGNAALTISKGTDTSNALIDLQKAGSLRWRIACETTAESGGNAGSDFVILARDDAGAALATALKITRSTGAAAFSTQGTFGGYPVEWSGYNARPSDADHTLTVLSSAGTYERFTGTLTAARQVTLSTTGAIAGNKFFITRTGGGAFNLNIGTGPLKALATGQWCIVVYDGAAWYLAAFGSL